MPWEPQTPTTNALLRSLRKRGRDLLHQQCWQWGQDVRYPEGNVLLAYGFTRERPPREVTGSSQYTLRLTNAQQVRLWGFGLAFGYKQGIYLNRYEFIPRAIQISAGWQSSESFKKSRKSMDLRLLSSAIQWIADYEAFILNRYGSAYRRQTLRNLEGRKLTPEDLLEEWRSMAAHLRAATQWQSEQTPYTKNSWPVIVNPRGSFGFTFTSQPESSKSRPQTLHWK